MTRGYLQENFSQRQLRSAEVIRKALYEVFLQGKLMHRDLIDRSITMAQVNVTIDLKLAKVYVASFGDDNCGAIVGALNESKVLIRRLLAQKINFKYSPDVHFYVDDSFDHANKINKLLKSGDKGSND